eukprot:1361681-Rhodomonas_salina.1
MSSVSTPPSRTSASGIPSTVSRDVFGISCSITSHPPWTDRPLSVIRRVRTASSALATVVHPASPKALPRTSRVCTPGLC